MERRDFLRTSCSFAIAAGTGVLINTLSGCSASKIYKTTITDNKISVPLSIFLHGNVHIVRAPNLEYDIALRRDNGDTYSAFLMRCTHADNQLLNTGNGFICKLHGSSFSKEGSVTKGPATLSLKKYKTEVSGETLTIYLT